MSSLQTKERSEGKQGDDQDNEKSSNVLTKQKRKW
jgi:hypothetical protein